MNVSIIGTRGVPNHYGGFEQLAQYLSKGLVSHGHSVTVYNSHKHPYKKSEWQGVRIIHCYDGEGLLRTFGQFIYDLNCIRNARRQHFDVIFFLGYTSSSIWYRYFPKHAITISNMDGLEWKRTKYTAPVRRFLLYAEKLAAKHSHYLIADSTVIQQYLWNKYKKRSEYIAYGATVVEGENEAVLLQYGLQKQQYYMLMARMEPENNIDMILEGFHASNSRKRFVVVGKIDNRFGRLMKEKYGGDYRIAFIGAAYDMQLLHSLKYHAAIYFHGHSVGGTNPSLLEAMSSKVLIAAHDNEFNRAVMGNDGHFFSSWKDVQGIIERASLEKKERNMIQENFRKVKEIYSWDSIIAQYNCFINECYNAKK